MYFEVILQAGMPWKRVGSAHPDCPARPRSSELNYGSQWGFLVFELKTTGLCRVSSRLRFPAGSGLLNACDVDLGTS